MAIKLKITHDDYSAEVDENKTVIIKCKDKKLSHDLVFEAVEVADVALISFTIDGVPYQAVEGMTWADWVVDTNYNTGGYGEEYGVSIYKGSLHLGSAYYISNDGTLEGRVKPEEPVNSGNYMLYEVVHNGGAAD